MKQQIPIKEWQLHGLQIFQQHLKPEENGTKSINKEKKKLLAKNAHLRKTTFRNETKIKIFSNKKFSNNRPSLQKTLNHIISGREKLISDPWQEGKKYKGMMSKGPLKINRQIKQVFKTIIISNLLGVREN